MPLNGPARSSRMIENRAGSRMSREIVIDRSLICGSLRERNRLCPALRPRQSLLR